MRLIIRVLAGLYIAYLAVAVLVILPALNFLPHWYVKQAFERELHTRIILFNPFTLALEVRHADLPEHDGGRFASLENATVNLSVESLWWPGWVFDEVAVRGLYAHVRQISASAFNFSDMIPADEARAPAA